MRHITGLLVVTILFAIVLLVYGGQPRLTVNEGRGFDGAEYYRSAEQFLAGLVPVTGNLPYVRRVGVAWLPAQVSKATGMNLLDSALYLDLAATYLTALLLVVWLSGWFRAAWVRYLMVAFFLLTPYVALRSAFYYPMQSDPWGAFFFVASLLAMQGVSRAFAEKRRAALVFRLVLFSILICLGMLFRETLALLAFAGLFVARPARAAKDDWQLTNGRSLWSVVKAVTVIYVKPQGALLFLPFVPVAITHLWVDGLVRVDVNDSYAYWLALFEWLHRKSLSAFLTGVFQVFGPLLLLVPFNWAACRAALRGREELMVVLLLALAYGMLGGGDTERIVLMAAFPIVYAFIGIALERAIGTPGRWWAIVLIALQSVALRAWWPIPDAGTGRLPPEWTIPFLTVPGTDFDAILLHPQFGDYVITGIIFLQYMALLALTWCFMRRQVVGTLEIQSAMPLGTKAGSGREEEKVKKWKRR
jgi:hypothetical protein